MSPLDLPDSYLIGVLVRLLLTLSVAVLVLLLVELVCLLGLMAHLPGSSRLPAREGAALRWLSGLTNTGHCLDRTSTAAEYRDLRGTVL